MVSQPSARDLSSDALACAVVSSALTKKSNLELFREAGGGGGTTYGLDGGNIQPSLLGKYVCLCRGVQMFGRRGSGIGRRRASWFSQFAKKFLDKVECMQVAMMRS